jgi:hypothetical protein
MGKVPLTRELLVTLEPEDILMPEVPEGTWRDLDSDQRHVRAVCPACQHCGRASQSHLGKQIQCPACRENFLFEWGDLE